MKIINANLNAIAESMFNLVKEEGKNLRKEKKLREENEILKRVAAKAEKNFVEYYKNNN